MFACSWFLCLSFQLGPDYRPETTAEDSEQLYAKSFCENFALSFFILSSSHNHVPSFSFLPLHPVCLLAFFNSLLIFRFFSFYHFFLWISLSLLLFLLPSSVSSFVSFCTLSIMFSLTFPPLSSVRHFSVKEVLWWVQPPVVAPEEQIRLAFLGNAVLSFMVATHLFFVVSERGSERDRRTQKAPWGWRSIKQIRIKFPFSLSLCLSFSLPSLPFSSVP